MGLHCAQSMKEISLRVIFFYLVYQLLAALCKANVRYCHGSAGCILVCLFLPSTSQSALCRPFIDHQELDEFRYSDAPRQAADECPSGTRTFSRY